MMTLRLKRISVSLATVAFGIFFVFTSYASARTEESVRVIQLSDSGFEQAHSLAFSSTGQFLAVGGTSGIYLYDSQNLSAMNSIQTGTWAHSITFVSGADELAAGLFDNTIRFWDVPHRQLIKEIDGHAGWVRSISISGDGSLIASGSDDNTIHVWRVDDGSSVLVLNSNTEGVRAVALSPDGKLVAGALRDHTVRVWSIADGALLYTLTGHEDWVRCLVFSPDGKLLASGSFDKTVRIWSMSGGALRQTLQGHTSSVLGVAFSPDGKTLASGSVDQTIRLWNASDGSPIHVLQGHTGFVYAVAFSPDGKTLASGGADNTVRLWNLESLSQSAADTELASPPTPSDCRVCHHRRGQVEPARVIELSCENCHAGGIGLSWCQGFARSSNVESTPIKFNAVDDVSGVPVNSDALAIVIASPGNGETLYVQGDFMVPEVVSGKVYIADQSSLANVEVHLDIMSNGQTAASLVTHPEENGDFKFNLAINIDSPPPYMAKPATRQCLRCHGDFVADAGLPEGDVHIVVTAVAPDKSKAADDRWIHVDASQQALIPVQVMDEATQKPLPGLSIEASTILYQWRDRFSDTTSGSDGRATLTLEGLTQAQTTYTISIPPQVLNGILYASPEPVELVLDPDAISPSTLTLTARALVGQINGQITGADSFLTQPEMKIWAIQLPAGPAYHTSLLPQESFIFEDLPVGQYVVFPDPSALASQHLYTAPQNINLFESPLANVSISPSKGRPIYGMVFDQDENFLPFAWTNIGDQGPIQAIDLSSGGFLILNFPAEASFVTVSAPGYYSASQSVTPSTEKLDFQLAARPETQFVPWGDGQLVLPSETKATLNGLDINLEYGWIWGQGGVSSQPLKMHVPGADISLVGGPFALEQPVGGAGWLYLYQGGAQVTYNGVQAPVEVRSGQMVGLVSGANPMDLQAATVISLHPRLEKMPVFETIEPSLRARVQNWLVKTGIGALQFITFITYILSLVTLITIPLLVLFWNRKKRRSISDSQENH